MHTPIDVDEHGAAEPADDVLLTPAEAAAESGFALETIRDNYQSGKLRAYQPSKGGRVRIPRSALHEWLGRPAARIIEPIQRVDWSIATPGTRLPDVVVCDDSTLNIPVHVSRLSEFHAAKAQEGR